MGVPVTVLPQFWFQVLTGKGELHLSRNSFASTLYKVKVWRDLPHFSIWLISSLARNSSDRPSLPVCNSTLSFKKKINKIKVNYTSEKGNIGHQDFIPIFHRSFVRDTEDCAPVHYDVCPDYQNL
ncbi:hypothetical protein TNCV_5012071 [Trichonephila clavipes]|nr:hypothetical protein TNCV_5012071 [Trichonephila clavipes]